MQDIEPARGEQLVGQRRAERRRVRRRALDTIPVEPRAIERGDDRLDRDARRRGLNVLCITDHNEVAGGFRAQEYAKQFDDIEVVVGDEVMCDEGEVIGLWLTEKPKKYLSPEEAVDIIHEQGGLAVAPHPFSVHVDGLQERILDLPLEGIEVMNGGHPDAYSN